MLDKLWEMTAELAGISRVFYDQYYQGKDKAVANRLGKVKNIKDRSSYQILG